MIEFTFSSFLFQNSFSLAVIEFYKNWTIDFSKNNAIDDDKNDKTTSIYYSSFQFLMC